MCTVKKPKVDTKSADKPLPILRNPILDGMLGNIAAIRNGRNAFRINLINPLAIPVGSGSTGGIGGGLGAGGSGGGGTSGGTSGGSSGGSGGGSSYDGSGGRTGGGTRIEF